jgi:porphyrinogen peroxidase
MTGPAGPEPQPVLSPPARAAIFIVVSVKSGGEQAVRDLLPDLAGLQRSVGSRISEGELTCVAGVGSAAWDRLFGKPRPAGLHPFLELAGAKYIAISTPGDLLFHIRARHMDLCFELATQIMDRIAGWVTVDDEVHGFRYFDERDLLGFVDGTENPRVPDAAPVVLVGDEDWHFAGGSYVVVQKYLHDLRAWNALPAQEQERVVGRTKLSNIELPDEVKPANSHVALTAITGPDGVQQQILRANMPFGNAGHGEFGTYFIGYARTPEVIEQMLANMFIGSPADNYDRILDYSTAVSGGLFFVPSAGFLARHPGTPDQVTATGQPAGRVAAAVIPAVGGSGASSRAVGRH